jgi:hypothetical protein
VARKLVWANVRFRPARTLIGILIIAIRVTLILILIVLSRGMRRTPQRDSAETEGRHVRRATYFFKFSGAARVRNAHVGQLAQRFVYSHKTNPRARDIKAGWRISDVGVPGWLPIDLSSSIPGFRARHASPAASLMSGLREISGRGRRSSFIGVPFEAVVAVFRARVNSVQR